MGAHLDHEFRLVDGVWWCITEDVISDECFDEDRCSNQCVCNDKGEEEEEHIIVLRLVTDADGLEEDDVIDKVLEVPYISVAEVINRVS